MWYRVLEPASLPPALSQRTKTNTINNKFTSIFLLLFWIWSSLTTTTTTNPYPTYIPHKKTKGNLWNWIWLLKVLIRNHVLVEGGNFAAGSWGFKFYSSCIFIRNNIVFSLQTIKDWISYFNFCKGSKIQTQHWMCVLDPYPISINSVAYSWGWGDTQPPTTSMHNTCSLEPGSNMLQNRLL